MISCWKKVLPKWVKPSEQDGQFVATLHADTVIIAKGAQTNGDLYTALVQTGLNAHRVGDCKGVGYIVGAVREAADLADAEKSSQKTELFMTHEPGYLSAKSPPSRR